jgi:hypothetical protein
MDWGAASSGIIVLREAALPVADARVVGLDRWLAVLQALHQCEGGKAERVLVERELHRRRALVLFADDGDRRAASMPPGASTGGKTRFPVTLRLA